MLFLVGCGAPSREERAALAAKGYYDHLVAGEYEAFLEGRVGAADLPGDYRQQLLAAYEQFVSRQQQLHRGISRVQVSNARTDSTLQCTNVFLLLCFGDSTAEEVVVPMVELPDGRWRMK